MSSIGVTGTSGPTTWSSWASTPFSKNVVTYGATGPRGPVGPIIEVITWEIPYLDEYSISVKSCEGRMYLTLRIKEDSKVVSSHGLGDIIDDHGQPKFKSQFDSIDSDVSLTEKGQLMQSLRVELRAVDSHKFGFLKEDDFSGFLDKCKEYYIVCHILG